MTEGKSLVAWVWRGRTRGCREEWKGGITKRHKETFEDDRNVFVGMVSQYILKTNSSSYIL